MNKNNQPPVMQNMHKSIFLDNTSNISNNPLTRISTKTKTIVENVLNETNTLDLFVDVHMHAFNQDHIPADFTMTSMGLPKKLVDLATQVFKKKLHRLVRSSPSEILDDLLRSYNAVLTNVDDNTRPDIFLVLLMMDMERGITGGVKSNFLSQLRSVLQLKKEYTFPYPHHNDRFDGRHHLLPFIAIDPNNPDAYSTFLSVFSKKINATEEPELDNTSPFVGVKIYPSLGYLPNHPVLMDIFEICQEKNIPVTTHAGGERTHTSYRKMVLPRSVFNEATQQHEDQYNVDATNLFPNNNPSHKEIFLFPETWRKVLNEYPQLKLNIAHCGSSEEWEDVDNPNTWNSIKQTFALIRDFGQVYADFSYSFTKKSNLLWLKRRLDGDTHLNQRIMYGSDFYLNEVEKGSTIDHVLTLTKIMPRFEYENVYYKNAFRFMFEKVI